MVFTKQAAIGLLSGLSNEIIGILETQGAAKLREVKIGGLKI